MRSPTRSHSPLVPMHAMPIGSYNLTLKDQGGSYIPASALAYQKNLYAQSQFPEGPIIAPGQPLPTPLGASAAATVGKTDRSQGGPLRTAPTPPVEQEDQIAVYEKANKQAQDQPKVQNNEPPANNNKPGDAPNEPAKNLNKGDANQKRPEDPIYPEAEDA